MVQPIYRFFIELTNGRVTSGLLRRFAKSKVSKFLVPSFAKVYGLNLDEVERSLQDFPTLHDLFIRKLHSSARQIDDNYLSVVSPVDAVIEDIGLILPNKQIEVKGKTYSVEEMLGNAGAIDKYINGTYMIFYLSPTHYHRIHSPVTGKVIEQWTLGNKSYPVNKLGLKYGKETLSKNYRKITEVKTTFGHVAIVKVGAMFVNSIETTHEGNDLMKGQEMAYFSFGSTVVLLFEEGTFNLNADINPPKNIKVGQKIGEFTSKE